MILYFIISGLKYDIIPVNEAIRNALLGGSVLQIVT